MGKVTNNNYAPYLHIRSFNRVLCFGGQTDEHYDFPLTTSRIQHDFIVLTDSYQVFFYCSFDVFFCK